MSLFADLGYAVRSLRKNPGFSVAAILTLALGIGANTAIYSVVNAVLLRPLPYPEPDRLIVLWEKRTQEGTRTNAIAPADYLDWQARNHSFQALDAEDQTSVNLTGDGQAERLVATIVTSGFVPTYGVAPVLGRAFTNQDESGDGHTVMLSYGLWQNNFGGDSHILGRTIRLNDEPYQIDSAFSSDARPTCSCRWFSRPRKKSTTAAIVSCSWGVYVLVSIWPRRPAIWTCSAGRLRRNIPSRIRGTAPI